MAFLQGTSADHGRVQVDGSSTVKLIKNRVLVHAREPLGETHVLARSLECRLVREIRRLDDERFSFPPAAELPSSCRTFCGSCGRPSSGMMRGAVEHLDEDHHVSRRLHDLIVVVVGAGEHRRPIAIHQDAPHAQRLILHGVRRRAPPFSRLRARGCSPPPFVGQRRKSPVWRVHDQRRAEVHGERRLASIEAELREIVVHVLNRSGYRSARSRPRPLA